MTLGKSALLTVALVVGGIVAVASPAAAKPFSDTNWKSVSVGGAHACATDNSSYLYCWGSDDKGQLGNSNALESKVTPVRVGSDTGWSAVSTGGEHTCGIRSGKLYCWGSDDFGQLGNGAASSEHKATPQAVSGATDWVAVTTGNTHTCAIRNVAAKGRMLACWGDDAKGQIGNGINLPGPSVPAFVSAAVDWQTITAGAFHTCGLRANKPKGPMLACWGNDEFGQVGNGALGEPSVPAQVSNAYDWQTVVAGDNHTCAIRSGGMLACWGSDASGQIGNGGGVGTGPSVPAKIGSFLDWKSVSVGGEHSCGIRSSSNKLYCWGDNSYGQTAPTSEDPRYPAPQEIGGSWKVQDTGQRQTCAIKSTGQLECWGVPELPPNDCPTDVVTGPTPANWADLPYWKLTIPVDADSNGVADEVKQPTLKILDAPAYFDRLGGPTRIKFRAETTGATTSGSSFPRSELREMTQDGQYKLAAWDRNCGTHRMSITQAITSAPTRTSPVNPVVAGQIHDKGVDGGHGDVAMVRLEGTRLFVEADGLDKGELDPTYELHEKFTVEITATSSGIKVVYNNLDSGTSKTINPFPPTVDNKQWYFKAGVYTQACAPVSDKCAANRFGTGEGAVEIFDLQVTHS